jgi:hypothetical protein
MKKISYLIVAFFLLAASSTWAAKPIENLIDVPVPVKLDGSKPTLEEVKNAIIAGCKRKGWKPVLGEGNQLICSILVRGRHFAEVEIPYSASEYSILYKNSRELDYNEDKQRIHRNYNKWVVLLSGAIQQEL